MKPRIEITDINALEAAYLDLIVVEKVVDRKRLNKLVDALRLAGASLPPGVGFKEVTKEEEPVEFETTPAGKFEENMPEFLNKKE